MNAKDQLPECAHEREVLDLVLSDRWPDRCDAETLAHVAECEVCADVVAVALAMRDDQALQPIASAPVPDATLVWWRAQLRAHEDAGRKAARPIAMVQGIGIGIAGIAALSLGRTFWPWIREFGTGLSASAGSVMSATAAAAIAAPWLTLGVVVSVIAAPVAVYFALGRE
ncbi:MAG: hypothetical protein EPO35_03770 [Acidobacteria bacterium]|nr:MAG: hypothetical protein EPO35_03770 [Acidobacteriota bacterium]